MGEYKAMLKAPADWIGQIPEHWECKKIGSLFTESIRYRLFTFVSNKNRDSTPVG